MEDSEPNVASIIKNAYDILDCTREIINNYDKEDNLKLASEKLKSIEENLNQIPEEQRCWNSRNCLDDIKRQKIWIDRLTGMLYPTN